jgi:hypothetical protein
MLCSRCVYRIKYAFDFMGPDSAVDLFKECIMRRDFSILHKKGIGL